MAIRKYLCNAGIHKPITYWLHFQLTEFGDRGHLGVDAVRRATPDFGHGNGNVTTPSRGTEERSVRVVGRRPSPATKRPVQSVSKSKNIFCARHFEWRCLCVTENLFLVFLGLVLSISICLFWHNFCVTVFTLVEIHLRAMKFFVTQ